MSTQRQDAWTERDDLILAETVLNHIRNGSTQLAAFEEVGERLNRTAAACGFRWNAEVRKHYEKQIKEAKEDRKASKKPSKTEAFVTVSNTSAQTKERDYSDIIIQAAKDQKAQISILVKQVKTLTDELTKARNEIEYLKSRLHEQKPEVVLSEDYNAMLQILTRARELGILERIS
jgi:prespore-specific regulator